MRAIWLVIAAAAVFHSAVGCSKKKDAPAGKAAESPPRAGPPGSPSPGGKTDPPKSDPDTVLATFRANAGDPQYNVYESAVVQLKSTIPPNHPRRADAFRALVEVATNIKDVERKSNLRGLAATYAAREDVPELVALVNKYGDLTLYTSATQRLAALKDPRCAVDVARWWATRNPSGKPEYNARNVLWAIGTPAEEAVQPYTQPKRDGKYYMPTELRLAAISFLREFGTPKSLPLLQQLQNDDEKGIPPAATAAIAAIQQRSRGAKP